MKIPKTPLLTHNLVNLWFYMFQLDRLSGSLRKAKAYDRHSVVAFIDDD